MTTLGQACSTEVIRESKLLPKFSRLQSAPPPSHPLPPFPPLHTHGKMVGGEARGGGCCSIALNSGCSAWQFTGLSLPGAGE